MVKRKLVSVTYPAGVWYWYTGMSNKILMPKKVDIVYHRLDISNANISNVDISHVTLSPQIWNFETLKFWKLHLKFLLFVLVPSELDTSNVDISHITLSTQIWNLETLNLHFKFCLSLPSELDISNVYISIVDISHVTLSRSFLIIKNEMCSFEIRNLPF